MTNNLFSAVGIPPSDHKSDHSFNFGSLSRCFETRDFFTDPSLLKEEIRKGKLEEAVEVARNSTAFKPLVDKAEISGRTTYTVKEVAAKLVLRKCAENIKESANLDIKPRTKIVNELSTYLKEGSKYRVYRLDIKSFFERSEVSEILDILKYFNMTQQTLRLLKSFLTHFNDTYGQGLPRGVEISPALAEMSLKNFDEYVRNHSEVFYYSRFVDDIVIVTSGKEDSRHFKKSLEGELPNGHIFNYNKTYIKSIPNRTKGTNPSTRIVGKFDYLGYTVQIIDHDVSGLPGNNGTLAKTEFRTANIDLSKRKVNQIKSRIAKSFYAYSKNNDFELLRDRIEFLATNRNFINKKSNHSIPSGIYYNYSALTPPSYGLKEIDKYVKYIVTSKSGRLASKLSGLLSKGERKSILRIRFEDGYNKRVFRRFNPHRLREIARVWK